ncbi:GntR family transcriptional regulator [Bosea sp. (in: a-proteobacteria)]|uniref:GntR family transcriptional regulator n=1 Tax=Bosea sp. (in: a-proteobacteria) TaxID=1871050 RepID=UPI001ACD2C8D|nr:GntR family transcriptional regulator [Bosea sp. (in: a-proteobacteria)]MBN9440470.1 GntR family transcriptional regulator [Bosea sp. (in: a-proteobacteria)]
MAVTALKAQTAERVRGVAATLEEEIVLGWLMPRERLIEEELAERLDVKRHVVREALAELERVGLVERVPNRGAFVKLLDPVEVRQIYLVREALETLAAEQIPLSAPDGLLSQLEKIQGVHSAAVASGDARAAFRANMIFHEALFAACGNPHLVELIQTMAQKVHGARSITAASAEHLALARDEHLGMIEAIKAGDRLRLVALCRKHLGPSRDAYIAAAEARFARSKPITR